MLEWFYVMTISSLWNRERTASITVRGVWILGLHLTAEQRFQAVYERALQAWKEAYPTISDRGFTVDFYDIRRNDA